MTTGDNTHLVITADGEVPEVNLTFDDLFGPVLETARARTAPGAVASLSPELTQHLQTVADLLTQLRDVLDSINQIDPTVWDTQPPAA